MLSAGYALLWLVTLEAIGVLAFPVAFVLFPSLRDRGYAFSKLLGLLLLAFPLWLLGSLHFLPTARWSILLVLAALAVVSALLFRRHRRAVSELVRREWPLLLVVEVAFLLFYVGWALYRAYDPAINHTEQFMDFAFLNASARTAYYPPEDPWLSGHGISYYYLGYLLFGLVARLTAIPTSFVYNLSLATVPAMAAAGAVGLVSSLVRGRWSGLAYGALATVLLLVISNLEGTLELVRSLGMGSTAFWTGLGIKGLDGPAASASWYPNEAWWWWRATRVIDTVVDGRSLDYTIQEFPFFSHLLGDLHPHVMSLPFVMMAMALAWCLFAQGTGYLSLSPRSWPKLLLAGIVLGALGPLNAWDLPVFLGLALAGLVLWGYHHRKDLGLVQGVLHPLGVGGMVLALAFVLYLPFYRSVSTQVEGVLAVQGPVTSLKHFLIVWGPFVLLLAPFLVLQLVWAATRRLSWGRLVAAVLVPLVPYLAFVLLASLQGVEGQLLPRLLHILPGALLLGLVVYRALDATPDAEGRSQSFVLLLLAFAFVLVLGPELLFIVDVFGNRMNTVFKVYYQAWAILAVAGALAVYYWERWLANAVAALMPVRLAWRGLLAVMLIALLYYPLAAVASKPSGGADVPTLDGLAYLKADLPGAHETVEWLRREARPGQRLAEAAGGSYSEYGLFAAATGIPAPLNWAGHERQWRGSYQPTLGRAEDLATLYTTPDAQRAREIVKKYGLTFVVVGARERAVYGAIAVDTLNEVMGRAFESGDVVVYRVRE